MKKYLIALGSNLETQNLSRLEIINKAIGYFSQLNIILIKVSSFWESRSYPDKSQPDFINAVSEVHSELNPYQILHALKNIEKKMGRKNKTRWGNRVLDLDIIGSGSIILPNNFEFNKWKANEQETTLLLPSFSFFPALAVHLPYSFHAPALLLPSFHTTPT